MAGFAANPARDPMSNRYIAIEPARDWQEQLTSLVTTPEALFNILNLPESMLPAARKAAAQFPLRVPRAYLDKIQPERIDDPLLRQIMPIDDELREITGFSLDPLQETGSNPVSGVIHKYHGRVLFIAAPQCAIHCRYCFRRHFNYTDNSPSRNQWEAALDYVRENTEIDEVILSGGDPLSVSDRQIEWLLSQLDAMPQITRIRIHSRLPIVLPDRVTCSELAPILQNSKKQMILVVHCNHPQELAADVSTALLALKDTGTTLLNQTVLLRGVNDNAPVLTELSKKLFSNGVLPYYLHLLDKVSGTAHFDLSKRSALQIHAKLQATLPGYLVPKLVREEAGAAHKTLIL